MTDIPENVTLEFIARQVASVQTEVRGMREDMGILANAIVRLENRIAALEDRVGDVTDELRLVRMALTDHDGRLRRLEEVRP